MNPFTSYCEKIRSHLQSFFQGVKPKGGSTDKAPNRWFRGHLPLPSRSGFEVINGPEQSPQANAAQRRKVLVRRRLRPTSPVFHQIRSNDFVVGHSGSVPFRLPGSGTWSTFVFFTTAPERVTQDLLPAFRTGEFLFAQILVPPGSCFRLRTPSDGTGTPPRFPAAAAARSATPG